MLTPLEPGGCTYNLADVLVELHGGPKAAHILHTFADDAMIYPTLNKQYHAQLHSEAERVHLLPIRQTKD